MGGGNASPAARAKAQEKLAKSGPTSQLKANAAAMTIQCVTCKQTFMNTTKVDALKQHAENKHKNAALATCFPNVAAA
ncbi:BZ3500_MvSof-1268-A1-R1_Chr9g10327 [Microbotryum saponariae]|uniref:BZ3500_MvSof-1268-A1-R1_Chr9g10327 protein n=1 Tax=Microbotryum saponariae TaxID=289078 RepID=A0A2X0KCL2_9BASI|nr:BZ3501_MvSof-1269-A2-R1_Chr9g10077 [Microbotryum saponariae]SCZ99907.1 BZ3500_MvSof-1268-A1-R1_Chr9g10327 [Microbotryum saponariae]